MRRLKQSFPSKYGRWAVVAGSGEGLGAAFATELARRGMNVLLIARREHQINDLADEIRSKYGVEARWLSRDLGRKETIDEVAAMLANEDVGVLVYNAAHIPLGSFLDLEIADIEHAVAVNVRGPISLVHAFAPGMRVRGRGAIVLMSSLAGLQGSPGFVAYSSSKAFNIVLGEGLWKELGQNGIDVVTCIAGAIKTPGYANYSSRDSPGNQTPEEVARKTLDALPKGPRFVPGFTNRFSAQLLGRLLPRKAAIALFNRASRMKD